MSAQDTERSTVRTYVPAYQKREWQRQADAMDMSLSEFVRSMVQAGRCDFEVPDPSAESKKDDPTSSGDANPGGDALETRIVEALDSGDHVGWDELLEQLTEDIEERMEVALEELQRENRVTYSGRHGGYTLIDE